jgi:heptosyltransferase III
MRPDATVLAIIVARIGDTLLVTPALRALKAELPRGRLSVMAHPKRLQVLHNQPFIDEIKSITKTSAQFKGWLHARQFDYVLVWGHDTALLKYALRVGHRVLAFHQGRPEVDLKLAHAVPEPGKALHAVLHRAALLTPLDITARDLHLAYSVTDRERAWAKEWLLKSTPNNRKSATGRPLIGLQIASFPTKAHRDWPLENFAALIQHIIRTFPGVRFVVLGDMATARKAAPLLALHPECILVAAGKLSLRESAALMSELDLYIGVDTGPTHIAGALGIPMVAMYHCAYPGRNLAPLQNPACTMIEHPATGFGATITASMANISVEVVWHAVMNRLSA